MFEVMGSGGFLMTREAPNFKNYFPKDIFVTYKDAKDLTRKIEYFRKNKKERNSIVEKGQKFVLENYAYKDIVLNFEKDIFQSLKSKE